MSGPLSTPPKSLKRRGLRGFATPMACYFRFNNPDGKSPELPALRAEVREPGRSRPRLFLPAFFFVPRPLVEKALKRGANLPIRVGGLPQPIGGHTGPHSGQHGAIMSGSAFGSYASLSNPCFRRVMGSRSHYMVWPSGNEEEHISSSRYCAR